MTRGVIRAAATAIVQVMGRAIIGASATTRVRSSGSGGVIGAISATLVVDDFDGSAVVVVDVMKRPVVQAAHVRPGQKPP